MKKYSPAFLRGKEGGGREGGREGGRGVNLTSSTFANEGQIKPGPGLPSLLPSLFPSLTSIPASAWPAAQKLGSLPPCP